jgi:hypothetical protein
MESIAKDAFLAAAADTEYHDKWMTYGQNSSAFITILSIPMHSLGLT